MHTHNQNAWQHGHVFRQDQRKPGERRTLMVVLLTAVMMIVEITAGVIYGSMALLADGLHMASHATALGIAVLAYVVARRLANDRRFSFGVGKINSLAGFASAVLLLGFAVVMATESVGRLVSPIDISFDQALIVAFVGLVVNGFSAWLLASTPHDHGEEHDHGHDHHHDHNLRGAYLHVLADALTSILAIVALLAGKLWGANWLDPAMGILGALLVANWSIGLIRQSSRVLLDWQADEESTTAVKTAIEQGTTDRVTDLHLWNIGHGIYSAQMIIVSDQPKAPSHYKTLLPTDLNVVHSSVEIHRCDNH
ncbi:MAG TPA: CDF family Co(II)/Ni(II) efflux transporter DmeF [Woeseiaceae bacterium]|nr:CDF family Co(II)/Ni(II) efflux transporter DmeF [Woeseiaceae bacterium]